MKNIKLQVRLLLISNMVCWSLLAIILLSGFNGKKNDRFTEITAERINIVNADNTPVMVIANKQRIANPVMGGKTYPVEVAEGREYMAGIIFFNQIGDEMGGLIFNSFKQQNGRIAGLGHLSFDRFNDNQVLSLEYNENRNGVRSGLTFYDRTGTGSFKKALDLVEESQQKTTTPERRTEINNTLKQMNAAKELGAERLFIGSRNKVPQVLLKDENGNARIKLFIDSLNISRLQFLDEKGMVLNEYTSEGKK